VEFPLYGLDATWLGPRWIESFGGWVGDPVASVLLAHQAPDGRSAIFVYTLDRTLLDRQADRHGLDRLAEVANVPAIGLVNLTMPAISVPRPAGMARALVAHADARCARHSDWSVISWRVDGGAVPARVWRLAGGWAAFSDAVPDVYLAAAGVAHEPDGLRFARLSSGEAYGFDLEARLSIRVFQESRAAGGARQFVESEDWHPDQLRVLADR
jgi:hypothetical protein